MSAINQTINAPAIGRETRKSLTETALPALGRSLTAYWRSVWNSGADVTRLYRLNDHILRDIGLTRSQIGPGPTESFWRT